MLGGPGTANPNCTIRPADSWTSSGTASGAQPKEYVVDLFLDIEFPASAPTVSQYRIYSFAISNRLCGGQACNSLPWKYSGFWFGEE